MNLNDSNVGFDVLGTKQDARGVVLAQTGDNTSPEIGSDNAEWWQHVGFCSRPAKAQRGVGACQTVSLVQGSNDACIASRDDRCALPAGLGEGETCLYAGGPENKGTGQIRLSDNGTVATVTLKLRSGNTSAGEERRIVLSSGSDGITIDAGGGARIKLTADGGIELWSGSVEPPALASPITSFLNQLLASLVSAANSGGTVAYSVPLPTLPNIAAQKVRVT